MNFIFIYFNVFVSLGLSELIYWKVQTMISILFHVLENIIWKTYFFEN